MNRRLFSAIGPRLALASLCSAVLVAWPGPVHADDTTDLEGLLDRPVVTTASKVPEAESRAPATTTTITADDLRRYGIRSLNEAINYLSLGMVATNPLRPVEIGARGVLLTQDFGNHVLLLVNGHALNEPWDGTAYFERGAAIPLELIDRIEVSLGPGSVLYGSNAMLGVIHIITKNAKDYRGIHVVAESELPVSFRGGGGVGHEFTLFRRHAELTLQADYYVQSGPTFQFGPQYVGLDSVSGQPKRFSATGPATGHWGGRANQSYTSEVPSIYSRLVIDHLEVNVRAAAFRRRVPYLDSLTQSYGDFNEPRTHEMDHWASLDIKHRTPITREFELMGRLYGDLYGYRQQVIASAQEDCIENHSRPCSNRTVGQSKWAGLEVQGALDWFRDGKYSTMLGADGRVRNISSFMAIYDVATGARQSEIGAYDRTDRILGAYLQQTMRPLPILDINGGLRVDVDQSFGAEHSPRAAAVLRPWQGGTIKTVYAKGFRAPTYYERHFTQPQDQVAAVGLRPEKVHSLEASLEHRFGTQRVLFGVFRTWWYDMVLTETLSDDDLRAAIGSGALYPSAEKAFQYRNISTIDAYGWNCGYDGSLVHGRLRYGLNATGSLARRSYDDGRPDTMLPVAPQVFGNARVSYAFGDKLPTAGIVAQYVDRRPSDAPFDTSFVPRPYAPRHLEVRATLSGAVPRASGLSYRISANYSFANRGPYVIGPTQDATPYQSSAELNPVDRFRTAITLQYDLSL